MKNTRLPELLAPAGDRERLEAALLYGADAVYLGGPELSLRAASGFTPEETAAAVELAHARGARVHYCLNALPRQAQMGAVRRAIEAVRGTGVDAFIVADPGVLALARRLAPHVPLHLSTQANTANAEAVAFWRDQGVARVVLARELDAPGVRAVRDACPDMELELFVHGAMCMAISGRCLLSAHLSGRSANQGACTHPCRYEYRPLEAAGTDGETAGAGMDARDAARGPAAFEERTRPGRATWEVERHGGYDHFFAAEDLCLVRYAAWFARLGIAAVKIEGRTKTAGYVAQVVHAWRAALDAVGAGFRGTEALGAGSMGPNAVEPNASAATAPEISAARTDFDVADYLDELRNAATRPLCTGFFLPDGRRAVLDAAAPEERRPVVARVLERVPERLADHTDAGTWRVAVRAPWSPADAARVLVPRGRYADLAPGGYALLAEPRPDGAPPDAPAPAPIPMDRAHPGTTALLRCTDAKAAAHLAPGVFLRRA